MKKISLISLAVATLLFVGCGDDKKAATQATQEVSTASIEAIEETTEVVTEIAQEAVEAVAEVTEEAAIEAIEAAEEAVAEVVEEAIEAVEETTQEAVEAVEKITQEATEAVANAQGKALYTTCAACHGPDGKTLALGKGAQIAGQSKEQIVASMNEYKAGTRDITGNGMLMKGQVANLSDADIEALAEYIASF